jgi:hypothetical protein
MVKHDSDQSNRGENLSVAPPAATKEQEFCMTHFIAEFYLTVPALGVEEDHNPPLYTV